MKRIVNWICNFMVNNKEIILWTKIHQKIKKSIKIILVKNVLLDNGVTKSNMVFE